MQDEQAKQMRQEEDEKHATGDSTGKKYKFKDAKKTYEEALREEERRERQEKSKWCLNRPNCID